MKTPMILIAAGLLFGASMADAIESTLYPENTTIRHYPKRDRLLIGGLDYVSPAQLHENEGLRARFGAELQSSNLRLGDRRSDMTSPQATADLVYGWDQLTLGLGASYLDATNEGPEDFEENFEARKLLPQIAYTFGENVTLGAGVEMNWLDVTEKGQQDVGFDYQINRAVAGIAYHTPRWEFGVTYSNEVQASTGISTDAIREGTLSLAALPSENERAVYLPAMTAVYARGNLTDSISMMSSVAYARYDGNVDGAIELFERYSSEDRLAAKLMGTYWTSARSHISLAGEYKGAATTAIGSEEAGLGYRFVNLYGATLQGAVSINRSAYLGLLASYNRGERNQTSNAGERFSGREETSRMAGFITVKI